MHDVTDSVKLQKLNSILLKESNDFYKIKDPIYGNYQYQVL